MRYTETMPTSKNRSTKTPTATKTPTGLARCALWTCNEAMPPHVRTQGRAHEFHDHCRITARTDPNRACRVCGKQFIRDTSWRYSSNVFCSEECKAVSATNCACGQPIPPTTSRTPNQFCSNECKTIFSPITVCFNPQCRRQFRGHPTRLRKAPRYCPEPGSTCDPRSQGQARRYDPRMRVAWLHNPKELPTLDSQGMPWFGHKPDLPAGSPLPKNAPKKLKEKVERFYTNDILGMEHWVWFIFSNDTNALGYDNWIWLPYMWEYIEPDWDTSKWRECHGEIAKQVLSEKNLRQKDNFIATKLQSLTRYLTREFIPRAKMSQVEWNDIKLWAKAIWSQYDELDMTASRAAAEDLAGFIPDPKDKVTSTNLLKMEDWSNRVTKFEEATEGELESIEAWQDKDISIAWCLRQVFGCDPDQVKKECLRACR